MDATAAVLDFSRDEELVDPDERTGTLMPIAWGSDGNPTGRPPMVMSEKQIRARARRKLNRITPDEQEILWGKPVDQWDIEELAKGRPKDKNGNFSGRAPGFIPRAVHEQVLQRFEQVVKSEMQAHTVEALKLINKVLTDDKTDSKGKPVVSANTKLDAAKFLIEHVIGKPKQRTETDISVKLQGILGVAMATPIFDKGGQVELAAGYIEAESWEDEADLSE